MRNAHEAMEKIDVTTKDGTANFVTEHDVRIQNRLIDAIKSIVPDACFIAEEKENDPTLLQARRCFVIDPIDGTTNFIHNCRHSCVSLGLLSHGEVVFGAVYNPYLDEMFYAERGQGAYLNDRPIQVANHPFEQALVAYGTAPYYKKELAEKTFALCHDLFFSCADVRRCGSAALDLVNLAAGRYDLFFEFLLSPWDIAAGSLIITEAGGIISDMKGNPVDFSHPCPILASTPHLYEQLLTAVRPYID